jgi:hypothetical protein
MDATPKLDFGAGDYRVMTIEIKASPGRWIDGGLASLFALPERVSGLI